MANIAKLLSGVLVTAALVNLGCGGGSPMATATQPAAVTSTPPALPSHWQATDLVPILGAGAAQANALNAAGHVVGYSVADGSSHATLWKDGQVLDLGFATSANGINSSDQIVGYRLDSLSFAHAVIWPTKDQRPTDLGEIKRYDSSIATGINSSGVVVGVAFNQANPNQQAAFSWTIAQGIQIIPGCQSAEAINDKGQVAGLSSTGDAAICGGSDFGQKGVADSINSAGQAAGFVGSSPDAFFFPSTDLGKSSAATGINDYGWVVGNQIVTATGGWRSAVRHLAQPRIIGTSHPWVWSQSTGLVMLDGITTASGINASGQIVGAAILQGGVTHGVLLTAD